MGIGGRRARIGMRGVRGVIVFLDLLLKVERGGVVVRSSSRSFLFVPPRRVGGVPPLRVDRGCRPGVEGACRLRCWYVIYIYQNWFPPCLRCRWFLQSLIDLAGSEKATSDKERTREGKYINTSLLTLGTVIGTLAENAAKNKMYVPTHPPSISY